MLQKTIWLVKTSSMTCNIQSHGRFLKVAQLNSDLLGYLEKLSVDCNGCLLSTYRQQKLDNFLFQQSSHSRLVLLKKTKLNKKRQGMANFSVCEALILFEHLSLYQSTSWFSLFQSADSDHRVTTAYLLLWFYISSEFIPSLPNKSLFLLYLSLFPSFFRLTCSRLVLLI